jgi:hypothetical protein
MKATTPHAVSDLDSDHLVNCIFGDLDRVPFLNKGHGSSHMVAEARIRLDLERIRRIMRILMAYSAVAVHPSGIVWRV